MGRWPHRVEKMTTRSAWATWHVFRVERAWKPFYGLMQKVSPSGLGKRLGEPFWEGFMPAIMAGVWVPSTDLHDLAQPVIRCELNRVDEGHKLVEHDNGL